MRNEILNPEALGSPFSPLRIAYLWLFLASKMRQEWKMKSKGWRGDFLIFLPRCQRKEATLFCFGVIHNLFYVKLAVQWGWRMDLDYLLNAKMLSCLLQCFRLVFDVNWEVHGSPSSGKDGRAKRTMAFEWSCRLPFNVVMLDFQLKFLVEPFAWTNIDLHLKEVWGFLTAARRQHNAGLTNNMKLKCYTFRDHIQEKKTFR